MKAGDRFNYHQWGIVTVFKVHPFQTVDVIDSKGNAYRISGLRPDMDTLKIESR